MGISGNYTLRKESRMQGREMNLANGKATRHLLQCAALLIAWLTAGGCGSKGVVTVTLSPTTATVKLEATEQFTAAVTGNSNTNVTWAVNSVTGGNSSVGTISTQGLYTAPANALNASTVSVTATSVADTSKSATATVTISSGATVTVFPTTGVTLAVGDTYQFTDTVTNTISNSTQATAVYWYVNSVLGGNATTGTITTTGEYTAPSEIGSTTTFVIKATLQADSTSSGTTNVTVSPAGAPTLSTVSPSTVAQGSYFEDIYLSGGNFLSTSTARINGTPVATTFITSGVITARIPAMNLTSAGTLFVDVEQQAGSLSSVVELTVAPTAPALISTTPNSATQTTANGGSLTIGFDGGYYTSSTSATVNGTSVSATAANSRQLNVAVSNETFSAAGLYSVIARNQGVAQITGGNFAVQLDPNSNPPTVLTTLGVGTNPSAAAINTATGVAVIANTGGNSLSLINLATQQQTGTITVGVSPTSVAVDNLRNLAITANNGDDSISIVSLPTATASATTLATITNTTTTPIDVYPYAVALNPQSSKALVVYQNSSTATVIDYSTPSAPVVTAGQIPTTGAAPQVNVDPRLNWAFVTPGGSGTVAVVDLNHSGQNIISLIAVPSSNGAVRDSDTVTITTSSDDGLTVGEYVTIAGVDDSSFDGYFKVASTPSSTSFTYSQSGANTTSGNGTVSAAGPLLTVSLSQNTTGICINNETEQAVFTDPSTQAVSLMSLLDQSTGSLTLETGTYACAINPLTNETVTVNEIGNTASILNLQTPVRTARFTVGHKPVAVALDPVSNIAVTVNQADNTVTLIQLGAMRSLQVEQMSPTSTLTSTSSVTLTLVGNGFTPNSVVTASGTNLTTIYVNSREITAAIPATMLGAPVRYVIQVNDSGAVSNLTDFYVMQAINVGLSPRGIALDRQRHLAVVTNSGPVQSGGQGSVSIINTNTYSISGTLNVGTSPQGVALSSIAGRAAVTNTDDDTVSIIDLDNIAVATTVSVAPSTSGTYAKPIGIAVHPGSGEVVVADSDDSEVSFFNITNPGTPTTLTLDAGPNAVAIDPTRNIAAVTEGSSSEVVIVDLSDSQILDRVTGFQLPTGAMYDPDSGTFLVTSSLANNFGSVTAHPDTGTYSVNFYRVGINPTALDYNYRSSTLVSVNTSSQNLSVMDFLSKTVKAILPLSVSQQFGVAIDPVTNFAWVVDQNNNRVLVVPLPN